MAIYAYIQGLSAGSDLSAPLTPDWFRVSSLSWGIHHQASSAGGVNQGLEVNTLDDLVLGRPQDGISPALANSAITGAPLGTVLVAVSESASPKCAIGFKLEGAFVSSWNMAIDSDGALQERLAVGFRKIALAMLIAGKVQLSTWDRGTKTPWNDAARSFYMDPRWGIRIR